MKLGSAAAQRCWTCLLLQQYPHCYICQLALLFSLYTCCGIGWLSVSHAQSALSVASMQAEAGGCAG